MTTKPITNVSASVRARLLELSRKNGEQFNFLLTRYALERLLYRLGSTNRQRFVLKGAMLFALWTTTARHRPTVDMDLLGYGPPSLDNIRSIFQTVASLATTGAPSGHGAQGCCGGEVDAGDLDDGLPRGFLAGAIVEVWLALHLSWA